MEEQNYTTQNNMNMDANSEGAAEVMSTKDWVFTLLVLLIPIVNLVFAIMWAIGGESVNRSKRNYVRASLIVGLSATVIMFLVTLMLGDTLFTGISMLRTADNDIVNDSEQSVGGYYYDGTETYTVGDIASGYLALPTYFTENTDISYTDFEDVMDVKQWYSGDDIVTLFTYSSSVSAAETQKSIVELIKKTTDTEHGEITIQTLGSNTIGLNDEYVCEYTEAYYDNSGEDYEASNWVFAGSDGCLRLITICHPTSSDENYWYFVGTYHE